MNMCWWNVASVSGLVLILEWEVVVVDDPELDSGQVFEVPALREADEKLCVHVL